MGHYQAGGGMETIRYPGICTAVIGSMTLTIKAQNALAAASIRTSVTKIGSARSRSGCAYGLNYPCMQRGNVADVLQGAGIRVRALPEEGS